MDRYKKLREDLAEIMNTITEVIEALEAYEQMPIVSNQMRLDVHISGMEIKMTNAAKAMRERLLV